MNFSEGEPEDTGEMEINELLAQLYDAEYIDELNTAYENFSGDYISPTPNTVFAIDGVPSRRRPRAILRMTQFLFAKSGFRI